MKSFRIYTDLAMTPEALTLLKEETSGHELLFPSHPPRSVLEQAQRDPRFAEAEIAFGQPSPEAIAEAPGLKWVQISSSGITRYDTPEFRAAMRQRRLPVCNSASVFNESCAAQTLAFMLAQARCLPRSLASRTPNGSVEWAELRQSCHDLRGDMAVIVGYGAIGRRLAELLEPFGMRLYGCRRSQQKERVPLLSPEELDGHLPHCDHVINILPDSVQTANYFDRSRLSRMKAGSIFYNIGRGTTVDQQALVDALRGGPLAAAWLDVTEPEPLPDDHPLRAEPNCYITPHVAGGHAGETLTLVKHFLANLRRFEAGETLLDRVM